MSTHDTPSRLKRDLSFSSTNSLSSLSGSSHGSALRANKRGKPFDGCAYRPRVSFGHLDETVLFDKKDSSSNLSLGVSVSNSSFSSIRQRSSTNFRWGETRPESGTSNATWVTPPPQDFRWQCPPPVSRPNMLFSSDATHSSVTSNALRSIGRHQSDMPKKDVVFGQQPEKPTLPAHCSSPTHDSSMKEVQDGLTRSCSLMAPPSRPVRCASPETILPEPIKTSNASPEIEDSATPIFGMPPRRPVRSTSPVTVTPRSSFSLGEEADENL